MRMPVRRRPHERPLPAALTDEIGRFAFRLVRMSTPADPTRTVGS